MIIVFMCSIINTSARIMHYKKTICEMKEGYFYCKFSKSCIPVTEECDNILKYSYIFL